MDGVTTGVVSEDDLLFLALVAAVAASVSLAVFIACYFWFRREQTRVLNDFFSGKEETPVHGELVAQFKVNHGKQVVSLWEQDGKRFLQVDGKLSAPERAKVVRYLKSEGFMS